MTSITVDIRVIPRSKRDVVDGERDGRLVVRTTAAPVDGSANERVIGLLARHFGVRPRQVEILTGQRSRDKTVRLTGVPARSEARCDEGGDAPCWAHLTGEHAEELGGSIDPRY